MEGSIRSVDRLIELLSVIDAGSIAAAAERGGMSRSTLSRRIASLEDEVGIKLIHRHSRGLALTHAGKLLAERARRIVAEADDAWRDVLSLVDAPSGPLRISTPPSQLFVDLLVRFAVAYPDVRLLVESTPRHVDLVRERIDLALRFGAVDNEQLIARKLVTSRSSLVASPAYLENYGVPPTVESLLQHRCIVNYGQTGMPHPAWPRRNGHPFRVEPHFACEGLNAGLHAAQAGVGIALLPDGLTQQPRAQRGLVFVLEEEIGMNLTGHAVFTQRRYVLPAVRAFIDFAVQYFHGRAEP